jgi:hypothetical protein
MGHKIRLVTPRTVCGSWIGGVAQHDVRVEEYAASVSSCLKEEDASQKRGLHFKIRSAVRIPQKSLFS